MFRASFHQLQWSCFAYQKYRPELANDVQENSRFSPLLTVSSLKLNTSTGWRCECPFVTSQRGQVSILLLQRSRGQGSFLALYLKQTKIEVISTMKKRPLVQIINSYKRELVLFGGWGGATEIICPRNVAIRLQHLMQRMDPPLENTFLCSLG